jgi:DNA processing protein
MIAAGGAVISPFAPDEPARPWQFLQRNGLVAALGDVVVIVEAALRSGALNTASWASDLGIDVLAFPGDVDRPKAAGCNALIRDGATLVRGPADVLAALGLAGDPQLDLSSALQPIPTTHSSALLQPVALRVLEILREGPAGFDELCERAGAVAADLAGTLVQLELGNAIERRDGSVYALRTLAPDGGKTGRRS